MLDAATHQTMIDAVNKSRDARLVLGNFTMQMELDKQRLIKQVEQRQAEFEALFVKLRHADLGDRPDLASYDHYDSDTHSFTKSAVPTAPSVVAPTPEATPSKPSRQRRK